MDLVLANVSKRFGGLRALSGVSFAVPARSIVGLIGPNGAGKTTLFDVITGVTRPDEGSIRFGAIDLARAKPAAIAAAGVARTFQNLRLFGELTAIENLLVAREARSRAGLSSALFAARREAREEKAARDRAMELLAAFGLDALADACATWLAYGHQRRLEIARAMMLEPKLLLLDEPAAGMSTREADELEARPRSRDRFGVAVLLVEHNVRR